MQIAMSKTREQYPLSRKKIWKKTVGATIAWFILLIIIDGIAAAAMLSLRDSGPFWTLFTVSLLIFAVIALLTYLYESWYFAVYFYDFTNDFIIIRKNPITPKEITIPYERIQDVYMDQDLIDRLMGLFDVHLSSATVSSGIEAHVDGLERPAAEGLRQQLLQTVSARIGKKPFVAPVVPEAARGTII